MDSIDLRGEVRFLRDLLMEAHNQFDLVYVDLDGERIGILQAVEDADALLEGVDK